MAADGYALGAQLLRLRELARENFALTAIARPHLERLARQEQDPVNLAIRGDCGTYMFSRVDDMFEFFRGGRINPGYWAEKTPGGVRSCRSYSREVFQQHAAESLADAEQDWPGITAAWKEKVEGDWPEYDVEYEHPAHEALRDFHYPLTASHNERRFEFSDSWEWDLTDFNWEYLWCCHAIQWGIGQHDARPAATSGSAA